MDLNTGRLAQIQTDRQLLDVTSECYKKIVNQLKRLECKQYVHVFVDANAKTAKIELIRMHLKFETKNVGDFSELRSCEFIGMRVALQQNCGSLYGLHNGLILESIPNEFDNDVRKSKILLLPHNAIAIQRVGNHVDVDIDVSSELRKPPFHRYQIDEFGRQIRSSNSSFSAWFYLAYLHAVTSYGEVEPLLGMSGTERALQILQSGLLINQEFSRFYFFDHSTDFSSSFDLNHSKFHSICLVIGSI